MDQASDHVQTHVQTPAGPDHSRPSSADTRIRQVEDSKQLEHCNNNYEKSSRDTHHVQFNSHSLDSGSESSDSSSGEVSASSPHVPDGGWGWVVVAASFFINLIGDGITFSFGIMFVDLQEYWGEGKSRTALIGSMFMAMPLLSGPIASFLADRFGCRRVTMFGALLAAVGFAFSAFVDSMWLLLLAFGVCAGFGLSLCYVTAIVVVAYYFDKRRCTATGISVSGSGIGTMVFAPLTRYLLSEYGWRGTLLVLSGFILNICVCGALMRDLPGQQRRTRRRRSRSQRTTMSSADSIPQQPHTTSLLCIPTYISTGETVPPEVAHRLARHYPGLLAARSVSSIKSAPPRTLSPPATRPAMPAAAKLHRHSLTYRGAMLNINRYHTKASSCPDIYRNVIPAKTPEKEQWYGGVWELYSLVTEMLDLSYFLDIRFLLFALSNLLLYTWYDVPYVYLYDSAMEMGFSEADSSYLISIIGSLNLVGELTLGWLGDQPGVNPSLVYAGCMLMCGSATALLPLFGPSTAVALRLLAGAFGLFIAANYSLTSIILVELISIERFTNGYGLLLLVQGIANLIGPPLAGWIYDLTDSYDLPFYLAGMFIASSGLLLLILPSMDGLRKYRERRAL